MIAFARGLAVGLAFTACPAVAAGLTVVATTSDLGAIAREVGGARVRVTSLAQGPQDPHFIDPRPSLLVALNKADMLIEGGLDLEVGWLPSLLDGARNPRLRVGEPGRVNASARVSVLGVSTGPVDRSAGDVHPLGNPHFLLDPMNGVTAAETIAERLCAVDQSECEGYRSNAEAFRRRIDVALVRWKAALAPFRGAKIVTYHESWPYFAARFDLIVAGFVEPKPGVPPPPSHVAALADLIARDGVKVIVMEPYFARAIPDLLARQTGARVLVLAPAAGGLPATDDYLSMFDVNVARLVEALSSGERGRS